MEGFHNWYRVEMQEKLTAAQYLESELHRLSTQIAFEDVQCDLLDNNGVKHNTKQMKELHKEHLDIIKQKLEQVYTDIDKLNIADKVASK